MSTAYSFNFANNSYFELPASKLKKGDFLKFAGKPFICMGASNLYGEPCLKLFGLKDCTTVKIRLTETVLAYKKIAIELERAE